MYLKRIAHVALFTIAAGLVCCGLGGCPAATSDPNGADQTSRESTAALTGPQGEAGPDGAEGPAGRMGTPGNAGPGGAEGSPGQNGSGAIVAVEAGGAATVVPCAIVLLDAGQTRPYQRSGWSVTDLTYQWSQTDQTGVPITLTGADNAQATFTVPASAGRAVYLLEFRVAVSTPDGEIAADDALVFVREPLATRMLFIGGSAQLASTAGNVVFAVYVEDPYGNPIGTQCALTAEDFTLQNVTLTPAGGQPVPTSSTGVGSIVAVSGGDVTAILDLDSSGSMASNDPNAVGRRAGAEAFFSSCLDSTDFVAMMDFGAGAEGPPCRLASRLLQDFTNDVNLLRAALAQLTAANLTPLWDSGLDALCTLAGQIGTGGTLVLLTDGQDTQSTHVSNDLVDEAIVQATPIYIVGLGNNIDFSELQRVAADTGGAFAEASDAAALTDIFDKFCTAVKKGHIKVHTTLAYPALPIGRCTIAGQLRVTSGGRSALMPFQFTAVVR